MKFGHLIEYNKGNETGRLVPDLFLFFEKALWKVKASGVQLRFNIV